MKKLLGLFLSATLIFALLVGCSKVEYRMYYLLSAKSSKPPSEISGIPIEEEHALFGDITSGVWHEPDHSVETLLPYTDEDAPKTFNIQIGDVKYELSYVTSWQDVYSRSENENIQKLGYYHSYELRDQEGRLKVFLNIFKDNFKIKSFGVYESEDDVLEGTYQEINEETATKLIESELKRLYSKDIFEQYDHNTGVWYDENEEIFECCFIRTVQGFETVDDRIIIQMDKYGRITSINAAKVGLFDGLADKISERKIVKAAHTLEKTLETDTIVVTSEKIYVDFDIHGNLFVRAEVSDINEKREVYATAFYWINVN